jgi:hypothetical protein
MMTLSHSKSDGRRYGLSGKTSNRLPAIQPSANAHQRVLIEQRRATWR